MLFGISTTNSICMASNQQYPADVAVSLQKKHVVVLGQLLVDHRRPSIQTVIRLDLGPMHIFRTKILRPEPPFHGAPTWCRPKIFKHQLLNHVQMVGKHGFLVEFFGWEKNGKLERIHRFCQTIEFLTSFSVIFQFAML